ncbi:MAG: RNA polymerase sigma factor [Erythrobacter sp.]|nr:RNA polymerase sigma factor [Erythrobacter sp.]
MEALQEGVGSTAERDDRLIERLQLGDLDAFEVFYKAYRPKLRGFILNIVPNEEAVDEVFDDVMMVVWNKIAEFEGRSKLSTWVFSIAYRRALKERAMRVEVEYTDEVAEPDVIEGEAERVVEASRAKARIKAALAKLPTDQGTVVRLAYFEGLNYRDIGAIMECPEDTVKTRMFHARRKLKAALGGTLADWV